MSAAENKELLQRIFAELSPVFQAETSVVQGAFAAIGPYASSLRD
jgi:hypothetical protein